MRMKTSEAEDLGGRAKMTTYEDAPRRVNMIRTMGLRMPYDTSRIRMRL